MLLLAAAHAHVPLTPHSLALLALTPIAGAVIFGAVFVATATVAFWWIDSGEIANGFTYGGLHFTQYPITIYGPALRRIFAYAVGFAFVAYYPTLALLDRSDPLGGPVVLLAYGAPVVAVVAAAVAALIWRTGVRHYRSTGS
jgi:ABC-2 type transport system permease protein